MQPTQIQNGFTRWKVWIIVAAIGLGILALWIRSERASTRRNLSWAERWKEARVRYFTPAETCSGRIGEIDFTKRIFVVETTPTCGLPMNFEKEMDSELRAAHFFPGERVTAVFGYRLDPDPATHVAHRYLRRISRER